MQLVQRGANQERGWLRDRLALRERRESLLDPILQRLLALCRGLHLPGHAVLAR
jgi:hypothetical protein